MARMRLRLPVAKILKVQRRWAKSLVKSAARSRNALVNPAKPKRVKERLKEVTAFGSNPGNLRMLA